MIEGYEAILRQKLREKGYDEAEIEALLSSIKEKDNTQEMLSNFVQSAKMVEEVPDELKPQAVNLVNKAFKSDENDDFQKMFKELAKLKIMLSQLDNIGGTQQQDVSVLREELESLREEIRKVALEKEEKEKSREIEILREEMKGLEDRIMNVIGEIARRQQTPETEEYDEYDDDFGINKALKELERLQKLKETLIQLGLVKEAQDTDEDINAMLKKLEEKGYRVQKPFTVEDLERVKEDIKRQIEQEYKEKLEQEKRRIEEEAGLRKEKMRMAFDFILSLVDGVMSAAKTSSGKKELSNIAEALKNTLIQSGGSEEEGSNGEGNEQA